MEGNKAEQSLSFMPCQNNKLKAKSVLSYDQEVIKEKCPLHLV